MFKLVCLFLSCIAVGNAAERTLTITEGGTSQGINYPGVTIKSNRSATEFTWNSLVSQTENALQATLSITLRNSGIEKRTVINLCDNYQEKTFERISQLYILNIIANVDRCPIKKGTKATFSVPKTIKYSVENGIGCGKYSSLFYVYKINDSERSNPILASGTQGNINGC